MFKNPSATLYFVLMGQQIDFCLKWSKSVQMGTKGSQIVKKHLGLPSRTLLDPLGPLWNTDKPAMFGHFCLFYWCFYFGTPCSTPYSHIRSPNVLFISGAVVNNSGRSRVPINYEAGVGSRQMVLRLKIFSFHFTF